MSPRADEPELPDDAVAMDFALGALGGDALRAAELRLRRDPAFAAEVAGWQADLAPLVEAVAPVAPPSRAWAAVEHELFRGASRARPAAVPDVSHAVSRAAARGVALWRGLAFAASAVAAVALALLLARPAVPPAPPAALLAASMASPDAAKTVLITATYDATRGAVILTPAARDASRGLTPELWVIVGKNPPQSLGIIDLRDPQAHVVPAKLRSRIRGGATLAISLEPAGGSPTGLPTGPVVAAGTLTAI